ncbi:MAG: DinB family protein, partial [Bryobacteraceae bacterium]
LQHVVNHSTQHRGQIVTLLRQLGQKPPTLDLIAYYRQAASVV